MKMYQYCKLATGVFAALCIVIQHSVAAPLVNEVAPDFRLRGMDQNFYTLASLRDPAHVLLVFGSADCVHCRAQAPVLNQWHLDYTPQQLRIVTINAVPESLEKTRQFIKQNQVAYLVLNNQHFNQEVVDAYDIKVTPTNVLVSPQGKVLYTGHKLPDITRWLSLHEVTPQPATLPTEAAE